MFLLVATAFQACKQKASDAGAEEIQVITEPLDYVPDGIAAFLEADLHALNTKADLPSLLRNETFKALLPDEQNSLEQALALFSGAGLDDSRPVLMYRSGLDSLWYMSAGLGHKDSLAAHLLNMGMGPVTSLDKLSYSQGKDLTVAWDDHVVRAVEGNPDPGSLSALLFQAPEQPLSEESLLHRFRSREGDLRFWTSSKQMNVPLPVIGDLSRGHSGAGTGIRLINEKGRMALEMDIEGLDPAQQVAMDNWFASAPASNNWNRLPSGTPAWMSVVLPDNASELSWMNDNLLGAMSESGTEVMLAFHQIKLPDFYPRISLIMKRRAGKDIAILESALKREKIYKSPGVLDIMGIKARYTHNRDWMTASSTDDPATLLSPPSSALQPPAELRDAFSSSPLRAYVGARELAAVLPLPMAITELKSLVIYALQDGEGCTTVRLEIRTSDLEKYGLNTTADVLFQIIPAVQMMTSFL